MATTNENDNEETPRLQWAHVPSHFEWMSEYITDMLKESEHPLKEKLFAFAERPSPSVSMIDVSQMDTEAINALTVFSTYMNPFKRVLIVTGSKDAASDLVGEYAGRCGAKARDQLIRRVFPELHPQFGNPQIIIPNSATPLYCMGFDLHILYPTHLTGFMERYKNKHPIDMVVVVDTKEPRRWSSVEPRVVAKYGEQAKILLLTTRPEAYEHTKL